VTDDPEPAKRRKPTSHIPRTLKLYADRGWTAQVVERRIPFNHVTIDLWGCLDVIAMHPTHGIVGIQVSAATDHARRRDKMLAEPRMATWLAAGGQAVLCSWALRKVGKGGRWEPREQAILLADMQVTAGPAIPTARQLATRERREARRAQLRIRLPAA